MKTKDTQFQKDILRWFSGLTVEQCRDSSSVLKTILSEVWGVKNRGIYLCRLRPCQKRVYSRGICVRHYHLVNHLRKKTEVSWSELSDLFLCAYNRNSPSWNPPLENDPLRILIKSTPTP